MIDEVMSELSEALKFGKLKKMPNTTTIAAIVTITISIIVWVFKGAPHFSKQNLRKTNNNRQLYSA